MDIIKEIIRTSPIQKLGDDIEDSIRNPNTLIPTPKYLTKTKKDGIYIPYYIDGCNVYVLFYNDLFSSVSLVDVSEELSTMAQKNKKMIDIYKQTLKNLEKKEQNDKT